MKHWSVNERELKKDTKQYLRWQLEQRINFGIGKKKVSLRKLKRAWPALALDPKKKHFLSFLLWGK